MREVLNGLWELQELDIEISELEFKEGSIPKQIQESNKEVQAKENELQEKQKVFEEHNDQRKKLDQEIKEAKDAATRYRSQLLQVKTNKEYQALLHEINTQETKISAYEEEILEHLAQSEELSKKVEKLDKELEKNREKFVKYEEKMQQELHQVEKVLLSKKEKRERLTSGISKALLSRYEQIRRGRGGVGVVKIFGPTCDGCNAVLPPQFVAEVKKGNRILTCEQCGRILVWKENVD